jgi:hypothetical protein
MIHSQAPRKVIHPFVFVCSHFVPYVFPQVPNVFLKMFPIAPHHFLPPYYLAHGAQLHEYNLYKGERRGGWAGSMTKCAFILGGREAYLGFYVGECPMF